MQKRTLIIIGAAVALLGVLAAGLVAGSALAFLVVNARPALAALSLQQDVNPEDGLLIAAVDPESPASQAGVVRGDILIEFNGTQVNDFSGLRNALQDLESGDSIEFRVLHGDELRRLTATLADRNGAPYFGISPCGGFAERGIMPFEETPFKVLPDENGEGFELPSFGSGAALIVDVIDGSPADQAGLQPGDLIVSLDGKQLDPQNDLASLVSAYSPGDTVSLEVTRLGVAELRQVEVTLAENPQQSGKAYLGVNYRTLAGVNGGAVPGAPGWLMPHGLDELPPDHPFEDTPFAPDLPQLPEDVTSAALVGGVIEGSPAEQAGIQIGDIIIAVDDQGFESPKALVEIIQDHNPGDKITLSIYRKADKQTLQVEATLGENPDVTGQAYLGITINGMMHWQFAPSPGEDQQLPHSHQSNGDA